VRSKGVADIGRAAQDGVAEAQLHRQRFAGERRLVKHRQAVGHRAIDRHHIAPPDQEPVAGRNEVERDLRQPAVLVPHGGARHPRQQGGHFAPGRPLGVALQELAAGIHQRDDGGGEVLPDGKRPAHRQRGDDVEPEVAAAQAGDDFRQQGQQHRHGDRSPDDRRLGAEAGEPGGQAGGEAERHQCGEELAGILERACDRHRRFIAAPGGHGHDQNQTPAVPLWT
jgi:hypothetical protein